MQHCVIVVYVNLQITFNNLRHLPTSWDVSCRPPWTDVKSCCIYSKILSRLLRKRTRLLLTAFLLSVFPQINICFFFYCTNVTKIQQQPPEQAEKLPWRTHWERTSCREVCKTLHIHKDVYCMSTNVSNTAIQVKFHQRSVVITDCLALSTMYLEEHKPTKAWSLLAQSDKN